MLEATRQCPTLLMELLCWHLTMAKLQSTGVMQDVINGIYWLSCQELCYRCAWTQGCHLL